MKLNHIRKYAKWNLILHSIFGLAYVFIIYLKVTSTNPNTIGFSNFLELIFYFIAPCFAILSIILNFIYGCQLLLLLRKINPFLSLSGLFYLFSSLLSLYWIFNIIQITLFKQTPNHTFMNRLIVLSSPFISQIVATITLLILPNKYWPKETIKQIQRENNI